MSALLRELSQLLPPGRVALDPATRAVYDADAQTAYRTRAAGVVVPTTTDEVVQVVRWCHTHAVPFVVRGSGTGLSAGATPVADGIVLVTTRLNRIRTLDPVRRLAVVEAGTVNAEVTAAAAVHGLFYAPDPSSQPVCTIGGNVGFNAGGAHCLKHGMTSNHVLGLRAVLANGEVVNWGSASREAIGPDWTGLFVGNEGRFGAALEVTLNLMPRPEAVFTVLAGFRSVEAAGDAVSAVIAAGMVPVAMELMDALTIEAVRPVVPVAYPPDCAALLVIELDGPAATVADEQVRLEAILHRARATGLVIARTAIERAAIWKVRKSAYSAYGRLAPSNFVHDVVVPRRHLGEALRRINALATAANLRCANICHAGDGNIHPNLLHDGAQPGAFAVVERVAGDIMRACVDLGGSITGEHGVGLEKRGFLSLMYGPAEMDLFRRLQRAFDPAGVANPGKMLEPMAPETAKPAGATEAPPSPALAEASPASIAIASDTVAPGPLLPAPTDLAGVVAAVRRHPRLIPIGAGTKPGLVPPGIPRLPLHALRGVTAYEPAEFVLTALAGTPLREIDDVLARHGQCLPFDAPLAAAGATLGGTVAAGLNGPAKLRRGGVRDSVLGLTFVDGTGQALTVGARVVKNVAGFDLPKFLVGSLGRLGVLTEITLKVAPRPAATRTIELGLSTGHTFPALLAQLARHPAEPEAIEARPAEGRVWVRVAGPESAVEALAAAVVAVAPGRILPPAEATAWWEDLAAMRWARPEGICLKVPVCLTRLPAWLDLLAGVPGAQLHVGAAGDVLWIDLPANDRHTRDRLAAAGAASLLWRGTGPAVAGAPPAPAIAHAVKSVLDPQHRFPALTD